MSGNDESVLDVLQAAANGGCEPIPMKRAHDRVAELIAADTALDEIDSMLPCKPHEIPDPLDYLRKRELAIARRNKALAACKGGA